MSEEKDMKGGISVDTEHLFPIIKKWLYSEKEIFLREIVSNASDAVTKLRRLSSLGQVKDIEDDFKITVRADKEEGTLTVSDNGIGMSEEEIRKYICNIALSGALEFIEKYEGEEGASNGIIGHFGLGFYSAFMVSDNVDVISKSYEGGEATLCSINSDGEYEISHDVSRENRGTDIIMHVTDDEKEFLEEHKLREVLNKYCSFVPVEIYLEIVGKEEPKTEAKEGEEEVDNTPKPINDISPLWLKGASECTDEEYNNFYQKLFTDYREPLFHIHINADYPLNFKGILYFPKLNPNVEGFDGQVKLFYNQVFVSDNIKELLPDYLLMLRGAIDCPELPLNVSRSYMQNSAYVMKMAAHISKKVADKINGMFNTDREAYEKLWPEIKLFVEFASMRDQKFYDRVKGSILLPLTNDKIVTVSEYLESCKEKHEKVIYYVDNKVTKASYVKMFTDQGIDVAVLDQFVDNQFINTLEQAEGIKLCRVDSDVADALKGDGEVYENEALVNAFKEIAGENTTVKIESLKDEKTPCVLSISEESRRFADMMRVYSMANGKDSPDMPVEQTLVLNSNCALIKKLGDNVENKDAIRQVYTLALISQRQLTAEELTSFLDASYTMIEKNI